LPAGAHHAQQAETALVFIGQGVFVA
jgi:hypothetical protein